MIESYLREVKRKKRNANFFWIITLFLSTILYFFFKGYYISIGIDLKNLFVEKIDNSTGSISSPEISTPIVSFNSFGIIHIKTFPQDGDIFINNSRKYFSGEKYFTSYGDYFVDIKKNGFLPLKLNFSINSNFNFYINDFYLLKEPSYNISDLSDSRIYRVGDNQWISYLSGSTVLFDKNFNNPKVIYPTIVDYIGDNKFRLGTNVLEFSNFYKKLVPISSEIIKNFVNTCKDLVINSHFSYCSDTKKIITNDDFVLTGVVDYGKNFALTQTGLTLWDNNLMETFDIPDYISKEDYKNFIKIDDLWYTNYGTFLKQIYPKNSNPNFFYHGFDNVDFIGKKNNNLYIIGNNNGDNKMAIFSLNFDIQKKIIDFPDGIDLTDTKIYEKNKNIFIKSKNSLLFIYNDGDSIYWIIDGKILAVGDDFSIYEKDDKIWQANWSNDVIK